MTPKELLNLEGQYKRLQPDAERFTHELARQLEHLLSAASIPLGFPVQARTKSWFSIENKLRRLALDLPGVLSLQDLVGARVILLFRRDLDGAARVVSSHFELLRSYDTAERLGTDQFGYSSTHLVIRLPDSWLQVPTMKGLGELKAEVQLRTLTQHTWAEISQVLQYKNEASVPPSIRRTIARVAALLETVDLEAEHVLSEREEYRKSVDTSKTDEPLNVDNLETMLDAILPPRNKMPGRESYAVLLQELSYVGIHSTSALERFMRDNLDAALARDSMEAWDIMKVAERERQPVPMRARDGVFAGHAGLVRSMLKDRFPERLQELWGKWIDRDA